MEKNKTQWKRMAFQNRKVWLLIDHNGEPIIQNQKVLIKYQLDHDYEYRVHKDKVVSLHDVDGKKKTTEKKRTKTPDRSDRKIKQTSPFDNPGGVQTISIYTDGSSLGNPGPAGIGALLRFGGHQKEISKPIGIATNNIAELEAVRAGLLEVKNTRLPIRVFTDSAYVYGVLSLGWKAKKNRELITSIKKIMAQFDDVKLIKIKGHAGIEGNEQADALATAAAEKSNGR